MPVPPRLSSPGPGWEILQDRLSSTASGDEFVDDMKQDDGAGSSKKKRKASPEDCLPSVKKKSRRLRPFDDVQEPINQSTVRRGSLSTMNCHSGSASAPSLTKNSPLSTSATHPPFKVLKPPARPLPSRTHADTSFASSHKKASQIRPRGRSDSLELPDRLTQPTNNLPLPKRSKHHADFTLETGEIGSRSQKRMSQSTSNVIIRGPPMTLSRSKGFASSTASGPKAFASSTASGSRDKQRRKTMPAKITHQQEEEDVIFISSTDEESPAKPQRPRLQASTFRQPDSTSESRHKNPTFKLIRADDKDVIVIDDDDDDDGGPSAVQHSPSTPIVQSYDDDNRSSAEPPLSSTPILESSGPASPVVQDGDHLMADCDSTISTGPIQHGLSVYDGAQEDEPADNIRSSWHSVDNSTQVGENTSQPESPVDTNNNRKYLTPFASSSANPLTGTTPEEQTMPTSPVPRLPRPLRRPSSVRIKGNRYGGADGFYNRALKKLSLQSDRRDQRISDPISRKSQGASTPRSSSMSVRSSSSRDILAGFGQLENHGASSAGEQESPRAVESSDPSNSLAAASHGHSVSVQDSCAQSEGQTYEMSDASVEQVALLLSPTDTSTPYSQKLELSIPDSCGASSDPTSTSMDVLAVELPGTNNEPNSTDRDSVLSERADLTSELTLTSSESRQLLKGQDNTGRSLMDANETSSANAKLSMSPRATSGVVSADFPEVIDLTMDADTGEAEAMASAIRLGFLLPSAVFESSSPNLAVQDSTNLAVALKTITNTDVPLALDGMEEPNQLHSSSQQPKTEGLPVISARKPIGPNEMFSLRRRPKYGSDHQGIPVVLASAIPSYGQDSQPSTSTGTDEACGSPPHSLSQTVSSFERNNLSRVALSVPGTARGVSVMSDTLSVSVASPPAVEDTVQATQVTITSPLSCTDAPTSADQPGHNLLGEERPSHKSSVASEIMKGDMVDFESANALSVHSDPPPNNFTNTGLISNISTSGDSAMHEDVLPPPRLDIAGEPSDDESDHVRRLGRRVRRRVSHVDPRSASFLSDEEDFLDLQYPGITDDLNERTSGSVRTRTSRASSSFHSTRPASLRRSSRLSSGSSSSDAIDLLDPVFDFPASEPSIAIPRSRSGTSDAIVTGIEHLDLDGMMIAKEFAPSYLLAKDMPHSLQDHMNSLDPIYLQSDMARLVFEATISENTAEDEPGAPPIRVFNDVDSEVAPPWEFHYSNQLWHGEGVPPPDYINLRGCDCQGPCDPKSKTCACVRRQHEHTPGISGFLYDDKGRLKTPDWPIFECNDLCRCSDQCKNRVVQHGRKCSINIVKTKDKGWGIFADSKRIPAGTYVGVYAGEILTDAVGEERGKKYNIFGRTYLFDIDFHFLRNNHDDQEEQNVEEWQPRFVVDAYHIGNFTRFLNHSCDPNCTINACYINESNLDKPLLTIFTLCDVEPYEELCFSYSGPPDDDYKDDAEERNDDAVYIQCKCGAHNCTGKMFT